MSKVPSFALAVLLVLLLIPTSRALAADTPTTFGEGKCTVVLPAGWQAGPEAKVVEGKGPDGLILQLRVLSYAGSLEQFTESQLGLHKGLRDYKLLDKDSVTTADGRKGTLVFFRYLREDRPTCDVAVFYPAGPGRYAVMIFRGAASALKPQQSAINAIAASLRVSE